MCTGYCAIELRSHGIHIATEAKDLCASLVYPDPYKKGLGNKVRSSVHIIVYAVEAVLIAWLLMLVWRASK